MVKLLVARSLRSCCWPPAARAEEGAPDAYRISGPVMHDNLAIYLVHGKSAPGPVPLTLQEALAQGKAEVHEKGDVNELEIENVDDKEVFVQAGDIVKGGQQDRVLSVSLIVPPKSGRMPIAAFCVEPGRWTKRGAEDVKNFGSADAMMPSKQSKLVMAKPAPSRSKREPGWKSPTHSRKCGATWRASRASSRPISALRSPHRNQEQPRALARAQEPGASGSALCRGAPAGRRDR